MRFVDVFETDTMPLEPYQVWFQETEIILQAHAEPPLLTVVYLVSPVSGADTAPLHAPMKSQSSLWPARPLCLLAQVMHNLQKLADIMDSRLSLGRSQQRGIFCLA